VRDATNLALEDRKLGVELSGRLDGVGGGAENVSRRHIVVVDSLEPDSDVVSRVGGLELIEHLVVDRNNFDGGLNEAKGWSASGCEKQ
jgi:hypothetical protein